MPEASPHASACPTATKAWLYYDGDCPFCSAYVKYSRFREAVGAVKLINIRDHGTKLNERVLGFDLDEGMLLRLGDSYYHGDDCIHMLALLSSRATPFSRLNAMVFRSPRRSRALYPILRTGRNLTLTLLGRRKFSLSGSHEPIGPGFRER